MDKTIDEVRSCVESVINAPAATISRLKGGGNNQIWRTQFADGRDIVCKFYFTHPSDKRDRFRTDYQASQFLWSNGVRNIAQPIAANTAARCAMYQFVKGEQFSAVTLGPSDIDCASRFAGRLFELSKLKTAEVLPLASEACFSVRELLENIRLRIQKLQSILVPADKIHAEFSSFLHDNIVRQFELLCTSAGDVQRLLKHDAKPACRTLSPSDFGFHNALRREDGEWIFFDFEYFGWDDPVKLISDFPMHPGMNLTQEQGSSYVKALLSIFGEVREMRDRLAVLFPLFGLKWCCIVMNEFVPEYRERRGFADKERSADEGAMLTQQLEKGLRLYQRFCQPDSLQLLLAVPS